MAGGLTAVMWTDFVQTILMIVGAFILMAICKESKTEKQKYFADIISRWTFLIKYENFGQDMIFYFLLWSAFNRVGGYNSLTEKYFYASPSNVSEQYQHCAYPPSYAMHFFRPIGPGESDLPWTGMVFGIAIVATWYFCTDQVNTQHKVLKFLVD